MKETKLTYKTKIYNIIIKFDRDNLRLMPDSKIVLLYGDVIEINRQSDIKHKEIEIEDGGKKFYVGQRLTNFITGKINSPLLGKIRQTSLSNFKRNII